MFRLLKYIHTSQWRERGTRYLSTCCKKFYAFGCSINFGTKEGTMVGNWLENELSVGIPLAAPPAVMDDPGDCPPSPPPIPRAGVYAVLRRKDGRWVWELT